MKSKHKFYELCGKYNTPLDIVAMPTNFSVGTVLGNRASNTYTMEPNEWAEKVANGELPNWQEDNSAYNYDNLRALLNKLVERNIDLQNRLTSLEATLYPEPTKTVVENTKRILRRG